MGDGADEFSVLEYGAAGHALDDTAGEVKSALTSRVQANKLIVLDQLTMDAPKTKAMQNVLNSLNVNKALVVTKENDANVVLSARNIPDVKTALVNTINVYDVMKYNTVVLTKDAVAAIEEVYA